MRKDNPPKLGKNDPDSKKFNLDDLKGKASVIKDKSRIVSDDASRHLKLDKSRDYKSYPKRVKNSNTITGDISPHKLGKSEEPEDRTSKFDKRIFLGLIVLIIIIIAGTILADGGGHKNITANQTNNTTSPVSVNQNHYDNGIISFDYPLGWSVSKNEVQAPLIVTVEKDPNNSFSIFQEDLGTTSFSEFLLQWRQSIIQNGAISYEGNISMDGVNGYDIESTYNNNTTNTTYNTRGVAIDKNKTAYIVIFIFNTSSLNYKDQMDQVINSFHVQQ